MNKTCNFAPFLILLFLLIGCSSIKHLKEGDTLYTGTNKMRIEKADSISENFKIKYRTDKQVQVWKSTWVPPNGAVVGLPYIKIVPMRLWFYNYFYTEADSGYSKWMMDNFGEPPKTIEILSPDLRTRRVEQDLFNLGHFDAKGEYKIHPRASGRKARVSYTFKVGPAYTIQSFDFNPDPVFSHATPYFEQQLKHTKIRLGDEFNIDRLEGDKMSLLQRFQDDGYFYMSRNNIKLEADTSGLKRGVRLRYVYNETKDDHSQVTVAINRVWLSMNANKNSDTLHFANYSLIGDKKIIGAPLLERCLMLDPNDMYGLSKARQTINNLTSTQTFSQVDLNITPLKSDSSLADVYLGLKTMNRFDIGLEGAVTTKSNNFVGPALGVRLTHRNIFRGGENLTYGVDAFYDFPTGALRRAASDSRGFIISGALTYPVVSTPLRIATHSHYGLPKAIVGISLEWNFRPEYFRVVNWKLNYGINWQPTSRTSHLLKWVELNYANVLTTTPSFDSILDSNTLIKSSFSNQFMIGPGYTFVYNTTREEDLAHQLYFQFGANLSGNVVSGIQSIFGQSGEEAKQFLGITYAQFARLRSDFRYYFNFNKSSRLVARLAAGVGFAYGNSDVMPFVTQFYTGGGTSLRPLAARIIGPGTYLPLGTDYDPSNTIEQSGDVFTEANVEYRFDIIYKLKGALWTDVGNIYLRKPDPQRPGGEFEISSFLRKSIMTSGVGLRVDFDFIVLRWDVGFISYYPWLEEGQRWFWQNDLNLFGGVINIGYPF